MMPAKADVFKGISEMNKNRISFYRAAFSMAVPYQRHDR